MMKRFRIWALTTLAVGLFAGPAAWAQQDGFVQSANVLYAVSLLDASDNPDVTTADGQPATADSTAVRVKVTLSIPRTSNVYGMPTYARPSRLMFRPHKGPETAFDGSILLVRDAPYGDNASSSFYPMPQSGDTIDYTAVPSRSALPGYAADGTSQVNPTRWECTYLSAETYNIDEITVVGNANYNPFLASLWNGQGTYEWYVAGVYGIGSFTRVSDIQDAGRKQTFTDPRVWTPHEDDEDSAGNRVDWKEDLQTSTLSRWGSVYHWTLGVMPNDPTWEIHGGVIGDTASGMSGVQLLGVPGTGDLKPSIVSPVYPDGIASVTFQAALATEMEGQRLRVEVLNGTEWTLVGEGDDDSAGVIAPTPNLRSYTVDIPADLGVAGCRFRIVRDGTHTGGEQHLFAITIRDLIVHSAAPAATFNFAPEVTPDPLHDKNGTWSLRLRAEGDTAAGSLPRGYEADIQLRRRADGDTTAQWRSAANVSVAVPNASTGASTLTATFTPVTLTTYNDGSTNVTENAFALNGSGKVTGALPGVYDVKLNYGILGSFLAGRDIIDQRESVTGEISAYTTENPDYATADPEEEVPEFLYHPMVVDLREQETAREGVTLRLFYRSGDEDSLYRFLTLDVPMLPDAHNAKLWRADIPRVLREATESDGVTRDPTAVYVWAPNEYFELPEGENVRNDLGEEGYLAFRVFATDPDGSHTWLGTGTGNASMPDPLDAVPATTATLVTAADEDATAPVVVPLAIPNSHISVAIDFSDEANPGISLVGAYSQDFNTWYAAAGTENDGFGNSDFREDVTTCTADFDVRDWGKDDITGDRTVAAGWIPDEGPLAETSSFTDSFAVARTVDQLGSARYPTFYYPDTRRADTYAFRQWGAAHGSALPSLLYRNASESSFEAPWSQYFTLNQGAELVLRRNTSSLGDGTWMPNAMVRLGPNDSLTPNVRANLNGIGTVSLSYTLSMPYELGYRAQLTDADDVLLRGCGLSAAVDTTGFTTSCAPSGVSISYYLEGVSDIYELRLTQILNFLENNTNDRPNERVVVEMYHWMDGGARAERLPLAGPNNTTVTSMVADIDSLAGNSFAFWVDTAGHLRAGRRADANNNSTYDTILANSADAVTVPEDGFSFAIGTAECAPTFRYLRTGAAQVNAFSGSGIGAQAGFDQPSKPSWGTCWSAQAESNGGTIRLTRNKPSSNAAGQLRLILRSQGQTVVNETLRATFGTMSTATVTLGRSNADLSISCVATNEHDGTGIFVDDISVSSWCGDDENRNGDDHVSENTNAGFYEDENIGFSAVGVWVRPRDDAELNVNQWNYSGEQVLLMQYSRRNTKFDVQTADDGTRTTGASLALYFPYSDVGYGPVSFNYCIPQREGGTTESVTLMLQYRASTGYVNDYLNAGTAATSGWVNVSDPIVLDDLTGAWSSVSVTPRLNGEEIVSGDRNGGTLRLVMVISDNPSATYDPYVYIDDVVVSDNRAGVLASWTAGNARLPESPIDRLYWKDRQAAEKLLTADGNTLTQDTFAEKAALTKAFQFNNATVGDLTHSYLQSPLLDDGAGVGRVSFAARLDAQNASPVRLYISGTISPDEAENLTPGDFSVLTYVDIENTVYTAYDLDLSKISFPEGITYRDIRRLRLWVAPRGLASADYAGGYDRVLIDRLTICDPVSPNLRITDVAFSNVAGNKDPAEFVSTSPLSQPVSGAPVLRVCATVGNRQLVKPGSVRVFFTYQTTEADTLRATSGSYTDVLNNTFSASGESPIYRWTDKAAWPVSDWFNSSAIDPAEVGPDANWALGAPQPTIELELPPGSSDLDHFYGDLSREGITGLPENSLVRYVVWAVYQGDQVDADGNPTNGWFMSVIGASDYKEPAWYFPRSLNAEIRDAYNADLPEEERVGNEFFSPYFWMYSCVPGEVFLNELNFSDHANAINPQLYPFAEICVPVGVNLTAWRFASTSPSNSAVTTIGAAYAIPSTYNEGNDNLAAPDSGVVPYRRTTNTSANRTFYTINTGYDITYRTADGSPTSAVGVNYRNAGWDDDGVISSDEVFSIGTAGATSALLYRPTGGAEHIVIFGVGRSSDATVETNKKGLAGLRDAYYTAYSEHGFAVDPATEGADPTDWSSDEALAIRSPWYQAFLDTSWEQEKDGYADTRVSALAHARRLAVADVFYAINGRYDRTGSTAATATWVYERDGSTVPRAVSVSTVDMGGKWVTRRNAVVGEGVNGPNDLTHILTGDWPADTNLTEQSRPTNPVTIEGQMTVDDPDDPNPVQVTPRQINPDQYLVAYSGLTQCGVISSITGAGTHTLYTPDKDAPTETRRGGNENVSWSVDAGGEPTATLTYDALPFHRITGIRVRMLDSASGTYLAEGERTVDGRTLPALGSQVTLPSGATLTFPADPEAENYWATVTLPSADLTTFDIAAKLYNDPNDEDTRYLLEAEATFAFDATNADARALITGVRPCTALPEETADGSAPTVSAQRNQPWRGSGFGFEADYDATLLEQNNLSLEAILVFYPDPAHRGGWGLAAPWVGANYAVDPDDPAANLSLEGLSFEAASEQIRTVLSPTYGTRVAQLNPNDGRFASASLVGILGTSYSTPDDTTNGGGIEPAIPYIAWGVYRATFQTDSGNDSVDFLVRQAMPGEAAVEPFTYPSWYAPVEDLNVAGAGTAMPYFYLYSTPPESAWLNEVNIANPAGDSTNLAAEVVMPVLRDGITAAGVPQTTPDGWAVRTYDSAGAQAGTASLEPTVDAESAPQSGSTSYAYYTATLAASNDLRAYVLFRPCGVAEGGVWLSADATGGTEVVGPTLGTWLTPGGSGNVFNGVTDSTGTAGSVQLVGQIVNHGTVENPFQGISSLAAERNRWAFRDATLGEDNLDDDGTPISPDPEPEWNQVAFTITLRNATYGTGLCGNWINGYFSSDSVTGRTDTDTVALSGEAWVYSALSENVFSFTPRTGYCFDSITLPKELIGHVMLIPGRDGTLTDTAVQSRYNEYIQDRDTADNPATVTTGDWLTLDGRATVERDANGEPTGVISFDRTFDEGDDETFADQDDFVITLLFVNEPASARNTITVSFAQGETGAGAWLATQTLFALDNAGAPDPEKGGETVEFPIWDDEAGNVRGEHKNVHGWLYQPLVGDKLGMSVVLDPARGLIGGRLGTSAQEVCQSFASGETQLYLVWSLIPAATVRDADPTGTGTAASVGATQTFFQHWPIADWLGSTPSVGDGLTTPLANIRKHLADDYNAATARKDYCADAGIVPLKFLGFRDPAFADGSVDPDSQNGGIIDPPAEYTADFLNNARLAFATLSPEDFDEGGFDTTGFDGGLAPFTQTIDMADELHWQNGAVLRFAIIVARGDTVYDAQGIANFTSDGFEGYCPWYVPDSQANINAHAIGYQAGGISPYAWVYGLAPDGVWLNEFRPTRKNRETGADVLSFGIELAMEASPVAVMTGAEGETPDYKDPTTLNDLLPDNYDSYYLRPKHSLDGWRIAVKVAPLPLATDPLDVPLAWTNVTSEIELKGWVPHRRLNPGKGNPSAGIEATNPAVYDTDYYVIGDTRIGNNYEAGFVTDETEAAIHFLNRRYQAGTETVPGNENAFCWFPANDPLALANIPEAARSFQGVYANGTLYALQLVRDNGVVADEILFCDYPAHWLDDPVKGQLERAVDIENASNIVSATVRSVTATRLSLDARQDGAGSYMLVDAYSHTNPGATDDVVASVGSTAWNYDPHATNANTFAGPNGWWVENTEYTQIRSDFRMTASSAGRMLALSAQILGGGNSGLLSLVRNGADAQSGRTVSFVGARGDSYALSVAQPWDEAWFRLASVTKNGKPLEAQAKRLTTFSVADAGTLRADASLAIDSGVLEDNTDYVLTLVYTPAAARLDASGALNSEDDGFLDWLLEADPDVILEQSGKDGVTASEKYWLGFDDATVSAEEVNLTFTNIGTYEEDAEALGSAAEPVPAVSIAFTNEGKPITDIRGDGALLLLGKVSLDDSEWRYVRRLYPEDLNGDRVLILKGTDCNFFRAVLLSVKDAEATAGR